MFYSSNGNYIIKNYKNKIIENLEEESSIAEFDFVGIWENKSEEYLFMKDEILGIGCKSFKLINTVTENEIYFVKNIDNKYQLELNNKLYEIKIINTNEIILKDDNTEINYIRASGLIRMKYDGFWLNEINWFDYRVPKEINLANKIQEDEITLNKSDNISIMYSGYFKPKYNGLYVFKVKCDDSSFLYLNNEAILRNFGGNEMTVNFDCSNFVGNFIPFKLVFGQKTDNALLNFTYKIPTEENFRDIITDEFFPHELDKHYDITDEEMICYMKRYEDITNYYKTNIDNKIIFKNNETFLFNNAVSFITEVTSSQLNLNNNFSILSWVKIFNYPKNIARIIGRGDFNNRNFEISVLSDGKIKVNIFCENEKNIMITSENKISLNRWIHLALVNNNNKIILYIDGIANNFYPLKSNVLSSNNKLTFGGVENKNNLKNKIDHFNGSLKNIIIFNDFMIKKEIDYFSFDAEAEMDESILKILYNKLRIHWKNLAVNERRIYLCSDYVDNNTYVSDKNLNDYNFEFNTNYEDKLLFDDSNIDLTIDNAKDIADFVITDVDQIKNAYIDNTPSTPQRVTGNNIDKLNDIDSDSDTETETDAGGCSNIMLIIFILLLIFVIQIIYK